MRNWKTTIVGALAGGVVAVQPVIDSGQFNFHDLLIGFFLAVLGAVAKDYNISGRQP